MQKCRNFCTGKNILEFSSLPGNIGGVICSNGGVIETIWCSNSETSFDETSGMCVPSLATTQSPLTSTTTPQLPPSYTATEPPLSYTTTQPPSQPIVIENIFSPENKTQKSEADFFQNVFDDFSYSNGMPQSNEMDIDVVESNQAQEISQNENVERKKKVKDDLTLLYSGSEYSFSSLKYYFFFPLIEIFVCFLIE